MSAPTTYRQPVSRLWWLKKRTYFLFVMRELSSVVVAWFAVFLMIMVVTTLAPLRAVFGAVNSTVTSPRIGEISLRGAAWAAGAAGGGVCANAAGAITNPMAAARATVR